MSIHGVTTFVVSRSLHMEAALSGTRGKFALTKQSGRVSSRSEFFNTLVALIQNGGSTRLH